MNYTIYLNIDTSYTMILNSYTMNYTIYYT